MNNPPTENNSKQGAKYELVEQFNNGWWVSSSKEPMFAKLVCDKDRAQQIIDALQGVESVLAYIKEHPGLTLEDAADDLRALLTRQPK